MVPTVPYVRLSDNAKIIILRENSNAGFQFKN